MALQRLGLIDRNVSDHVFRLFVCADRSAATTVRLRQRIIRSTSVYFDIRDRRHPFLNRDSLHNSN